MRQHITQDQLNSIKPDLKSNLIQIASLSIDNKNSPGEIHKLFTIGKLIEIINKHINPDYHIRVISQNGSLWQVEAKIYRKETKYLIDSLWDSFVWCFDDELRRKKIQEEIDLWKVPEELVDIKH